MKLSAPIFKLKRQAKMMSRGTGLPLHAALDALAMREGYRNWGHLSASATSPRPAERLIAALAPGDFLLLGARPSHGKTLLGLELAVAALREGRRAYIFSLEETERSIVSRLRLLGMKDKDAKGNLIVDASDVICADHIVERVAGADSGSIVLIDFLQLLDQRRDTPPLAEQLVALAGLARSTGAVLIMTSQIDRAFDLGAKRLPDRSDVRLPNPVDLTLFTKCCFLHDGEMELSAVA